VAPHLSYTINSWPFNSHFPDSPTGQPSLSLERSGGSVDSVSNLEPSQRASLRFLTRHIHIVALNKAVPTL